MSTKPDLTPAADAMAALLAGVTDEQLTAPTPCEDYTLGDLIDHVDGLSQAFTNAALKDFPEGGSQGPSGDASRLGDDWRTRIPARLKALAEAWQAPAAWEGTTAAGGFDLPAEIAGTVALNELVVHGWDVAVSTGQPFDPAPATLEPSLHLLTPQDADSPDGFFGPIVAVPESAPLLHRVLGLSGRDPQWSKP